MSERAHGSAAPGGTPHAGLPGAGAPAGPACPAGGRQAGRAPAATLPLNLLLRGRPCLVVGAGRVAARKVAQLLEAGARVAVVGREAGAALRALKAGGAINLAEREFEEADVAGCALVTAATGAADANLRVLAACRRRGIMCGCVDWHWRDGDFISPAVLRTENLTVAVSTGGQSCRRSRLVRDGLARRLARLQSADLLALGISHDSLPLRRLETLLLSGPRLEAAGALLARIDGLLEFTILSTCNRVELLALAADDEPVRELARRGLGLADVAAEAIYARKGIAAFEHACLLAAGLLSQAPGETAIAGQFKDALALSARMGWSGAASAEWFSAALHVSRRIRAEAPARTGAAVDVEDRAIALLRRECPAFAEGTGMVIGAGAVGGRLVERLRAAPGRGRVLWCYHRRPPAIPPHPPGRVTALPLPEAAGALPLCDYVLAAAGAREYILHRGHAPALKSARSVTVIDLGMPRNVDPALPGAARQVRLFGLEALAPDGGAAAAGLTRALEAGRRIAAGRRDLYEKITRGIQDRIALE